MDAAARRIFVVGNDSGGYQLQWYDLDTLEQLARSEDRKRMLLETGTRQPEALRLYERCGYIVCGPFGGYPPHPLSVFMEKRL